MTTKQWILPIMTTKQWIFAHYAYYKTQCFFFFFLWQLNFHTKNTVNFAHYAYSKTQCFFLLFKCCQLCWHSLPWTKSTNLLLAHFLLRQRVAAFVVVSIQVWLLGINEALSSTQRKTSHYAFNSHIFCQERESLYLWWWWHVEGLATMCRSECSHHSGKQKHEQQQSTRAACFYSAQSAIVQYTQQDWS